MVCVYFSVQIFKFIFIIGKSFVFFRQTCFDNFDIIDFLFQLKNIIIFFGNKVIAGFCLFIFFCRLIKTIKCFFCIGIVSAAFHKIVELCIYAACGADLNFMRIDKYRTFKGRFVDPENLFAYFISEIVVKFTVFI